MEEHLKEVGLDRYDFTMFICCASVVTQRWSPFFWNALCTVRKYSTVNYLAVSTGFFCSLTSNFVFDFAHFLKRHPCSRGIFSPVNQVPPFLFDQSMTVFFIRSNIRKLDSLQRDYEMSDCLRQFSVWWTKNTRFYFEFLAKVVLLPPKREPMGAICASDGKTSATINKCSRLHAQLQIGLLFVKIGLK